jgi:hypothetical protein
VWIVKGKIYQDKAEVFQKKRHFCHIERFGHFTKWAVWSPCMTLSRRWWLILYDPAGFCDSALEEESITSCWKLNRRLLSEGGSLDVVRSGQNWKLWCWLAWKLNIWVQKPKCKTIHRVSYERKFEKFGHCFFPWE